MTFSASLVLSTSFYRADGFWVIAVMGVIVVFLLAMYFFLRKKFAREISYRKKIVHSYERDLARQQLVLESTKKELERVTREIESYKARLQEKEDLLEEKIEQNKRFVKLLHQAEMEGSANDIIKAVRKASDGTYEMSEADWKMLLHAVDSLYPSFNDTLIRRLGNVDPQELRVCYLIRIGLTNPQIQNIMGLPRTTVWRWVKKYGWVSAL